MNKQKSAVTVDWNPRVTRNTFPRENNISERETVSLVIGNSLMV